MENRSMLQPLDCPFLHLAPQNFLKPLHRAQAEKLLGPFPRNEIFLQCPWQGLVEPLCGHFVDGSPTWVPR
jgi:hypothetical protein